MRYIKLSGLAGSKTIVNIDHIVSVANVAVLAVFSADIAADIVMQYGTEIRAIITTNGNVFVSDSIDEIWEAIDLASHISAKPSLVPLVGHNSGQ